jgi:hypothetical protein
VNAAETGRDDPSIREPKSPLDTPADRTDDPEWWPPAHQRVITASHALLKAQNPRALEQATAELIGAELHDAVREKRPGWRFEVWATQLIGRAADRVVDAARRGGEWQGPWRLLHGLAAIGSHGLDAWAVEAASRAARSLPPEALAAQPSWLKVMPDIRATGDVRVMRDAYGTRFAIIAEFRYDGENSSSWYLLDIDVCGLIGLASAGAFDTPEQAAAAWRNEVGVSAEGIAPAPATTESLTCLVYCGHDEPRFVGSHPRTVMENWFRGPRRTSDLLDGLRARGVELPRYRDLDQYGDYKPTAAAFTAWYSAQYGYPPERRVAGDLADTWLSGCMPGTEHAVSPDRSLEFRVTIMAMVHDEYDRDELLDAAPDWVQWQGEQAGIPEHLIQLAVAAA